MGYIVKIKCDSCTTDESLNIGQGFRDFDKEIILSYFSESIKPKVSDALSRAEIYNYERVVAYCRSCKKYISAPRLTYFIGNEKRTIYDKCQCDNSLDLVADSETLDGNNVTLRCLKCGGKLKPEITGLFD